MTKEDARGLWQVIKAYGEGKTIQFFGASGEWFDIGEGFELPIEEKLRIKPNTEMHSLLDAQANGKTIQHKMKDEEWKNVIITEQELSCDSSFYRIKPEELNNLCKWCKGKGCNCGTCPNKDKENSYYLLHKDKFPEPKEKHYRAFKNCDELVETYNKRAFIPIVAEGMNSSRNKMFRPDIWVKHKEYGTDNLITAFDNDNDSIVGSCVFIQDMWCDMAELFEQYTFLDGSPVGKLEE